MLTAKVAAGTPSKLAYTPKMPPAATGPRRGPRTAADGDWGMDARRRTLADAGRDQPLARVAALLIAIQRTNSYEGRDPTVVPEAVTSGFVADLLGVDIATLAAYLVELRERGLLDQQPSTGLRLKSIAGLEALADGD